MSHLVSFVEVASLDGVALPDEYAGSLLGHPVVAFKAEDAHLAVSPFGFR